MNREGKNCVLYPRVSTEMQVEGFQHRALPGKAQQILRLHQCCGFIACRVLQGVYLFSNLLVLMEAVIMGVTIGTGIIEGLVDATLMGIASI